MVLAGVIGLPVGLIRILHRRAHPLVLTCPRCRLESRNAIEPFSVTRFGHTDYAYVVCSSCGTDFTVPSEAHLI